VKEKLESNIIPIIREEPVFEGSKIALFKKDVVERWEDKKEELKMKKENEITEETILEMLAEYRSERWGI
jgi:predicted RNase H-like nuclease (RuvC/YqgF family)